MLGALGTASGSWIKVASASPDMFVVAFVGQTLVAMSQVFILSVPARLAAVWFGPNEVSSACSIGVFGNQVRLSDSACCLNSPLGARDAVMLEACWWQWPHDCAISFPA
jgi:hypothetical protein